MPSKEVVRFRSRLSLSFPPSAIYQIRPGKHEQTPIEMTVAFMGLTGVEGALPRHYTELLLQREQANDYALKDFLDLLNHRFISLFYRAWEKHHCVIGHEEAIATGARDRFADLLYGLIGLGTKSVQDRFGGDHPTLLRYAGLLAHRPRSAHALQQCLSDAFQVPVQINQFIGEWLWLEEEDQTRIGVAGRNHLLGQSAVAGLKVWDQQARFQVRLGPVDFETCYQLLPSGHAYPTLNRLINFVAGPELDFNVHIVVKASEVPACRLEKTDAYAPRLGWTTWLTTKPRTQDAEDIIFPGSIGIDMAHAAAA
jgi:type VI secretion system protein ImpH